jgi:hypothetical protein
MMMERPKAETPAEKPFDPDWFIKRLVEDFRALEAAGHPQPLAPNEARHPIFNRINAGDAWRLLDDFHSGLLAKHDDSLGVSRIRASGHGSALTNHVTAIQVEQALLLLSLMKPRPTAAHDPCLGWWVFCLDVAQGRIDPLERSEEYLAAEAAFNANPEDEDAINALWLWKLQPLSAQLKYGHLPMPTYQDTLIAFTVFAIQLFKECFGGSLKDLLTPNQAA